MTTLQNLLDLKSSHKKLIKHYQTYVERYQTALETVEKEIWHNHTFPSIEAAKAVLGAEHRKEIEVAHKNGDQALPDYYSDFVITGSDEIHTIYTEYYANMFNEDLEVRTCHFKLGEL